MKKPTRIVAKPIRVGLKRGSVLQIICDDGNTYTLDKLAKTINISKGALYTRLQDLGWDHPHILSSNLKEDNAENNRRTQSGVQKDVTKLSQLGNRVRNENIFKIKEFTRYDRMYGGGGRTPDRVDI